MPNRLPLAGLLHLLVTWVVWGSTYLAIRIAVREGAGWGPFWLGASRVTVAGCALMLMAGVLRRRVRPTAPELFVVVVSGLLMWVGGNGGVNWAEQRIDSGLAALIVGTMPMWVALAEAALERRAPSSFLLGAIVTGFGGLVVLTLPVLRRGVSGDLMGTLVIIGATVAWGSGTLLLSRRPVGLEPLAMGGWQQLAGAVGFLALALVVREPLPAPTGAAWGAWGYLVVFGSILAFTSYLAALRALPTSIVMTYTYVNPVIAVVLGRIVLGEPITPAMTVGMVLILAGVWGVFRDRHHRVLEQL